MSILALHGFTGCGADFLPLAQQVGGEWHCPELPGHGPGSQLDCSPQGTVDYINKVLTHHQPSGTTQKILLGYSMGARAALLHAAYHPEVWDTLILISGNPGIEDETERANRRIADAELADSIERLGMQAFLEFWQETPLIRSQKHITGNLRASMQANRLKNLSLIHTDAADDLLCVDLGGRRIIKKKKKKNKHKKREDFSSTTLTS